MFSMWQSLGPTKTNHECNTRQGAQHTPEKKATPHEGVLGSLYGRTTTNKCKRKYSKQLITNTIQVKINIKY